MSTETDEYDERDMATRLAKRLSDWKRNPFAIENGMIAIWDVEDKSISVYRLGEKIIVYE